MEKTYTAIELANFNNALIKLQIVKYANLTFYEFVNKLRRQIKEQALEIQEDAKTQEKYEKSIFLMHCEKGAGRDDYILPHVGVDEEFDEKYGDLTKKRNELAQREITIEFDNEKIKRKDLPKIKAQEKPTDIVFNGYFLDFLNDFIEE